MMKCLPTPLHCGLAALLVTGAGAGATWQRRPPVQRPPVQRPSGEVRTLPRNGQIKLQPIGPSYVGRNLKVYRGSALYGRLNSKFQGQWLTVPRKTIKFADGSQMRITMVKNPTFGNDPQNIEKRVKVIGVSSPPEGGGYECTTKDIQLTAKSTTFLNNDYGNANSHIYPGAIFKFEDFYSGAYREVPGQRNPMTLVTDNPNINGSSTAIVQNPNVGTIRDGIATIYRRFTGDVANQSTAFDVIESNNTSDLTLQLSGGASAYGSSFSAAFGMQKSERTYSLTIDARKSMYSISVLPTEKGFYVDPNIEKTPYLMVVGNVVYGVRVMANVNVTFNTAKDALDFKAQYNGIGFSAGAAINYLRSHSSTMSEVHGYIVGGPGNTQISFNKNDLMGDINRVMSGANYQNARPISYQFMDSAGNILGTQSATDTFRVVQCAPSANAAKLTSARVHFTNGSDGKDKETEMYVSLFKRDGGAPLMGYRQAKRRDKDYGGYADNSEIDVNLGDQTGGTLDANTFLAAGGGHLQIGINRHQQKDRWRISQTVLYLNFSDGSSKRIAFPNREFPNTSQSTPPIDFYFDNQYAPQP